MKIWIIGMHVTKWRKVVLLFAFASFVIASATGAAELRTYRFGSDQPRLLRFAGGLPDYDVSAQLAGSFDIELQGGGAAALTRFDVVLVDIVSQGNTNPSWLNGQSLAQILFANPVGLTGMQNLASIKLGSADPSAPMTHGPLTTITLTPGDGPLATLRVSSLPLVFLDNPSFATDSPGFLVQLVPEPSALLLAFCGFASIGCLRCRLVN